VHRGYVSVYVKNVDLISPGQQWNMREKTIKTDGRKLLLDALKLIGISGRNRVPDYRGIFQLGPD
jgi:hypothetical protein